MNIFIQAYLRKIESLYQLESLANFTNNDQLKMLAVACKPYANKQIEQEWTNLFDYIEERVNDPSKHLPTNVMKALMKYRTYKEKK